MSEYLFESGVTRAYRYLSTYYPGKVAREDEPPEYTPKDTLIIVKSGGGGGARAYQLNDVRLSFEVRAGDERTAEDTALRVEALLRDWQWRDDRIYLGPVHGPPQWDPDPDRRIPAFTWTMEFTFKSVKQI